MSRPTRHCVLFVKCLPDDGSESDADAPEEERAEFGVDARGFARAERHRDHSLQVRAVVGRQEPVSMQYIRLVLDSFKGRIFDLANDLERVCCSKKSTGGPRTLKAWKRSRDSSH